MSILNSTRPHKPLLIHPKHLCHQAFFIRHCSSAAQWFTFFLFKPQIYEMGTDSIESRIAHQPKTDYPFPNPVLVASPLMVIFLPCVGLPLAGSRRSNPPCPLPRHLIPRNRIWKNFDPWTLDNLNGSTFPPTGSRTTHKNLLRAAHPSPSQLRCTVVQTLSF